MAELERLTAMRLDIDAQEKLSITLAAAHDILERISLAVGVCKAFVGQVPDPGGNSATGYGTPKPGVHRISAFRSLSRK